MENIEDKNKAEEKEVRTPSIVYSPEKDFYKGVGGKLRLKAEGLFKKAKEKGISIEEIDITTLRENQVEFPGIGVVNLPAYIVKVKGRDIESGQIIVDGKQIDYFNRYQRYIAEKIEDKNIVKDEKGRKIREDNETKVKSNVEMFLTEWERFEIGKSLVDDKEFGLEKTITGACDRVIRKLMGENDWLYPEEARLLDEEFNDVQRQIIKDEEKRKTDRPVHQKRATERQINYLKVRIKNLGLDPESEEVIKELMRLNGYENADLTELSTVDMSKVIDSLNDTVPRVKEALSRGNLH